MLDQKSKQQMTMIESLLLLLITTLIISSSHAFQATGSIFSGRRRACASGVQLFSAVANDETAVKIDDAVLLKRDRYVATNRFTVRPGRAAKFEKRWGKLIMCVLFSASFHVYDNIDAHCFFTNSRSFFKIGRIGGIPLLSIDEKSWTRE